MSSWKDLLKIYGLILGAAAIVLPLIIAVGIALTNPGLGIVYGLCIGITPFIFGAYILYYLLKKKVTPSPYYYYYSTYNPNPYQGYGYSSYGAPPPYYNYPQGSYGYQPYQYSGYGYPYAQPQYQPVQQQPPRSQILPSEKDEPEEKLELPPVQWLLIILLISIIVGFAAFAFDMILLFIPCFVIGFSFPSLIWISYVYGKDIYEPEPGRVVLIALTWGMLSTIPALIFNTGSSVLLSSAVWMVAVFVAPFVEEAFKPLILPFLRIKIDNELDGIIYGVTAGMGFAIMENLNYELGAVVGGAYSWSFTTLARGLGSTVIHAVGAGVIGYAYARYHMKKGSLWEIGAAYLFAVGLHMTWNGTLTALEAVGGNTALAGMIMFMVIWPIIEFLILKIFLDRSTHIDEEMFGPLGARPFGKPRTPAPAGAPGALAAGPPSGPGRPTQPERALQPQKSPEPQRPYAYAPPPSYSYRPPSPPSVPQRAQPAYSPPPRPEPATRPSRPPPEDDFDVVLEAPPPTPTAPSPPPKPEYKDKREELI